MPRTKKDVVGHNNGEVSCQLWRGCKNSVDVPSHPPSQGKIPKKYQSGRSMLALEILFDLSMQTIEVVFYNMFLDRY